MPTIDAAIELFKLVLFMVFVASIATQVWIAFLDIAEYFTKKLNRFRPLPSQDKFSRIGVVIMASILLAFN